MVRGHVHRPNCTVDLLAGQAFNGTAPRRLGDHQMTEAPESLAVQALTMPHNHLKGVAEGRDQGISVVWLGC
ncbi:hypothetical protein GCM10010330_68020 [Streptomyces tendae]|nr:hypothetical protein GCM10010330_68020 [Streptomyces tendae]